ncbi:hypothetical protein SAMN05444920_111348 [Nonomuraea solani]|uniref:Uncharacterized protein n=1 Tax=Nonomuraea solani TaxID=1144553 RepID=A0A1H6EM81_9ACTN|nr:hypothetical protein SAMN05444920_111348 [Nonomuraea solani]
MSGYRERGSSSLSAALTPPAEPVSGNAAANPQKRAQGRLGRVEIVKVLRGGLDASSMGVPTREAFTVGMW